ncbi:MAG: hypothetical protein K2H15_02465, partial [Muribaculaceae bacterium]|nr:hypothetical protein [Muribaculaceae bacterium]
MKTLRNTIALLPLLTLAAACSDSDPAAIPAPVEGDFHVMMSVLPSGSTTTGSGSDAGTDAERAFDEKHIYFATYDPSTWAVKDWLMDGNSTSVNNEVEAAYFTPTWGPSIAARLRKEAADGKPGYSGGFAVGFFSVPANVKTSFT